MTDEDRPQARRPRQGDVDYDDRPRRRRRDDDDDDDDFDDRPRRRRDEDDIGQDAGMRLLLPVGRSGLAIAAGYLGLISVLVFPAPLALICGILAIRDIKRNPKKHGMGRALFGIVMGGLFSLGFAVAIVVAIINSK